MYPLTRIAADGYRGECADADTDRDTGQQRGPGALIRCRSRLALGWRDG